MKKFITAAFVVVVFSGIGYWQLFSAPQGKNATPEYIQIRSNERVGDIADELEAKNIIRSSAVFLIDAKIIGLDTKILPGRYQVDGSVNVQGIINALMHPKNFEVSVTVPEGFTVQDIDARLTKMGLISSGDFSLVARPLEGFLFPDTYFVIGNNFKPASLVKKMNDTFLRKFTPEMQSAVAEHKRTLKDVIIMASILEKEVNKKNDYPIVAGILWKRLDSGWPLQADAAGLYGKEMLAISSSDSNSAAAENPYNTTKNKGLPPTPICNPGLVAIQAAIFPEESPYWFYLTGNDGAMHYGKTNDEQNVNRRKYL